MAGAPQRATVFVLSTVSPSKMANPVPTPSPFAQVQTFVALVSAVVGVVAAVQALSSKRDADESAKVLADFRRQIDTQANLRAERESRAKLDGLAYDAVVKVLEIDRRIVLPDVAERRERAALALVASTASEAMQVALFGVVGSGPRVTPSVKQDAENAREVVRETGILASDPRLPPVGDAKAAGSLGTFAPDLLKGYRVVLFSCQNSRAPERARLQRGFVEKLAAGLRTDPKLAALNIGWETKELPEVLNSAAGYGISSNQIRYNPADREEAPSQALKALLESRDLIQASRIRLDRRLASQHTPSYLSVFLCGTE
jgi:hypothetical protein